MQEPTQTKTRFVDHFKGAAKWLVLAAWVGAFSGSASALFLWSLDWATRTRTGAPWLLFLLPVGGLIIAACYQTFGKGSAGGNNLLLDRIHDPNGTVIPFVMAPLVLVTTILTHLFGGSAGREGTAVQIGGTIADMAVGPLKLSKTDRQILIMTGIAAGFGSVFGTPFAGTIFGVEVLTIGRIRWEGLVPCLIASFVGDWVCRAWGIHHVSYAAATSIHWSPLLVAAIVLASCLFAGASAVFSGLTHWLGDWHKKFPMAPYVRPFVGGLVIIALTLAVGNQDYNGLGIPLIQRSFAGNVPLYAFALKILFTSITLGTGFKGGEVTPIFCIGATLGSAFALVTHQDPALFAAIGFVAVFAGAANTPFACMLMGMELFGTSLSIPLALGCFIAFRLSGNTGIYLSQKVHGRDATLRDLRHPAQ